MTANSIRHKSRDGILHIYDNLPEKSNSDFTTLLWSERSNKSNLNQISIVEIVEANSDELRKRYLSWIYDLGEYKIDGKSVIDHLSIQEGFSYWWSTSLGQKFNCSGSSKINDAIKALAFEDFFLQNKFTAISLVSSDSSLAKTISSFCRQKRIAYTFHKIAPVTKKNQFKFSYKILPCLLRAFITLIRYICKTLPLCLINESKNLKLVSSIIFIDILVHLKSNPLYNERFQSNYWTNLVDKLDESGFKTNWLHLFFKHSFTKSLSAAEKLTKKFSFFSRGLESHRLLERPLKIKDIFFVISNFLKIRRAFHALKKIQDLRPASSEIDLWPFHEDEWRESLCGSVAMDTCIKLSLFSNFFSIIPKQRFGVYICENQPWEFALIYAWKKYKHGRLIGVPHTTLRYWDLRYFYDSRNYSPRKSKDFLIPDFLAVNGPVARNTLLYSGYPAKRIVETEALRFMHLSERQVIFRSHLTRKPLKILVFGDFLAETNNLILTWLTIAEKALKKEIQYIFKPHPAYPLKKYDHSIKNLSISEAPLVELLNNCDLAFASNITSAAVDAYCLNIPLIQILDQGRFNTSPVKDMKNVKFVSTPYQFIDAINSLDFINLKLPSKYFFIDKNLSRWLDLLKIKQSKRNKIYD
jgi:surface carbohydrate biosynthesis protein (TIGR04326 family)